MALTLNIISKPNNEVLADNIKRFVEEGGSIGRAEHCDLCLPDASHSISKIHALIHYRDNMYFITDVSTNGVFINSETIPIGKGNTKQILEGERLQVGNYVLQASFQDNKVIAANASIQNKTSHYDDDIEALLNNNDDISDLLDVEISQHQISKASIVSGDELSIDDVLANLNHKDDDFDKLLADSGTDDAIADLLGTASTRQAPSIDVMGFEQPVVLSKLLLQLDNYVLMQPHHADVVRQIKQYLIENNN